MPKVTVEIQWNEPDEPQWLNPDNVALALHAYCPNTKFEVKEASMTVPEEIDMLPKSFTDIVRSLVLIRSRHLEMMTAAYLSRTNIDPRKVCLVEQHDGFMIRWYFQEMT